MNATTTERCLLFPPNMDSVVVNDQFASLITCNFPRFDHCRPLCRQHDCVALIAFAHNRPTVLPPHHMLIDVHFVTRH